MPNEAPIMVKKLFKPNAFPIITTINVLIESNKPANNPFHLPTLMKTFAAPALTNPDSHIYFPVPFFTKR